MLRVQAEQGVDKVILTPHYRGEFKPLLQTLDDVFVELKRKVLDEKLNLKLFLGQEIYYENIKSMLENNVVKTMNGGKYVLLEFDFIIPVDMSEAVYELKCLGYKPIVAHFERYFYSDVIYAREIKEAGGYIQINADSLVGKAKKHYSSLIKSLFKENLIDFVASDVHYFRNNVMGKAYSYVLKKYGKITADAVFKHNADKILEG